MVQVFLQDKVIIEVDEAFEDRLEGDCRAEAVSAQDIGDAAIEAFDHAVGLWGSGLGQAMFDAVVGADLIEGVGAGWLALASGTEAVGKFFTTTPL